MGILNVVRTRGDAQVVSFKQDLTMGDAYRWLKFVAGQLKPLAQRITEINRVHKAAIDLARVFDATLVEPLGNLRKDCPRDVEGDMVDIADALRIGRRVDFTRLIGKDSDQAAITGIEIKVALVGIVQV